VQKSLCEIEHSVLGDLSEVEIVLEGFKSHCLPAWTNNVSFFVFVIGCSRVRFFPFYVFEKSSKVDRLYKEFSNLLQFGKISLDYNQSQKQKMRHYLSMLGGNGI
jgi:hypothetical protein